MEQGTTNGVVTDMDGNFQISLKDPNAMLRFNYVGFKPVVLKAQNNMTVSMKDEMQELNEVVVVGYGTQKKANLTGAVANVDVSKAVGNRPITDVGKALQGITPGLTITNNTEIGRASCRERV